MSVKINEYLWKYISWEKNKLSSPVKIRGKFIFSAMT